MKTSYDVRELGTARRKQQDPWGHSGLTAAAYRGEMIRLQPGRQVYISRKLAVVERVDSGRAPSPSDWKNLCYVILNLSQN